VSISFIAASALALLQNPTALNLKPQDRLGRSSGSDFHPGQAVFSFIEAIKDVERPPIFEALSMLKLGYFILSVELRFVTIYGSKNSKNYRGLLA
jgi:hypothetical protein